jgi:hypothetical protein
MLDQQEATSGTTDDLAALKPFFTRAARTIRGARRHAARTDEHTKLASC